MKRTSATLARLLNLRSGSDEIFRCAFGSFTRDNLFSSAERLAEQLEGVSRQRIIIPSSNPACLLSGIAACWISNNAAVAWRTTNLDLKALTVLTDASRMATWHESTGEWRMDRLAAETNDTHPGDVVLLTSGSTGAPKGVALDLCRVVANASFAGARTDISSMSFWSIDADMSMISPLGHTFMAWLHRVPVHHLGGSDWHARDKLFNSARGGYGGSPLQLREMTQRLKGDGPRVMVSSGDFLPPALGKTVGERFPHSRLHKLYGLTEVSGRLCVLDHDERHFDPTAAGFVLPGFSILLKRNEATSASGELMVTGPTMMEGYWIPGGMFEALGSRRFETGDVGRIREDGLVTLEGRRDDVFKVGAEKVDRHSIEAALLPHLGQHEFCVLPVMHDVFGQTPALFVAATDRNTLPSRTLLIQAVRAKLPSRYVPTYMVATGSTLPRLANGKLDKQRLIRGYAALPDLYAQQN